MENKTNSEVKNYQKSISFSISGAHIFYHIGVGKYLQKNYNLDDVMFLGSSGGALVALCLAINYPIDNLEKEIFRILEKYNTFSTGIYFNKINNDIEIFLSSILTDEISCNLNNLIICNSIVKYNKIIKNTIKKFNTKMDLISNILASCHIPFLLDKKLFYNIDNDKHLDGLLTNFQPVLDENTIKVYPYMFNMIWKYLWVFTAMLFYTDPVYNNYVINIGYSEANKNKSYWNLPVNIN